MDQFVLRVIHSYGEQYYNAWEWKEMNNTTNWSPPLLEIYSIAFDVAVRSTSSTSAAICRSHSGAVELIIAKHSGSCNPNQGKVMIAFLGVKEAQVKHLKNIIIERDSQVIISALKQHQETPEWIVEGIIRDKNTGTKL